MNETEYERKEFQLASKREGELGAKRKTKSHVVCEIKVIRNEGRESRICKMISRTYHLRGIIKEKELEAFGASEMETERQAAVNEDGIRMCSVNDAYDEWAGHLLYGKM
ncbi:Hypothetical protein SMAX5B_012972 [Scophthalmus maximus]|uniref:Uncharacterized protein n=1 Tax=Scophthalmus maximus TaxID=52904 RepID=A0A2U9BM95_SCOMX|nr:Hypothetical protein SMAX5B_012972 [Scophthalmus maximus]